MSNNISNLERLKQLDEEREKIIEDAKREALENANRAVSELNALGFRYELIERGKRRTAASAPVNKGPCPICGFKTSPPHDRRAHRSQEPKKPFTAEELAAKGMARM